MNKYSEIHVCSTYLQLITAITSLEHNQAPRRTVLFIEDGFDFTRKQREHLIAVFPDIDFLFTTDQQFKYEFENLPNWVPAIIRRNIRVKTCFTLQTIFSYEPETIRPIQHDEVVIYNGGYAICKAIPSKISRVILREPGIGIYTTLEVQGLKAFLRFLSGYSPYKKQLGEEHWIDNIQVKHPERMSQTLKHKTSSLPDYAQPNETNRKSAHKFLDVFAVKPIRRKSQTLCILLTQPIEDLGFTREEKKTLYSKISGELIAQGYEVYVKNHPREEAYTLLGCTLIEKNFPIELIQWAYSDQYDLIISLCSNANFMYSVSQSASMSLIDSEDFKTAYRHKWTKQIEKNLKKLNNQYQAKVGT